MWIPYALLALTAVAWCTGRWRGYRAGWQAGYDRGKLRNSEVIVKLKDQLHELRKAPRPWVLEPPRPPVRAKTGELCASCGRPATGYARGTKGERLCHTDDRRCYRDYVVAGLAFTPAPRLLIKDLDEQAAMIREETDGLVKKIEAGEWP